MNQSSISFLKRKSFNAAAILIAAFTIAIPAGKSCPPPILEMLIKEGHYKEAIDYIDSKDAYSYLRRAEIYREQLKDNVSALKEINKAISAEPKQWNFFEFRAQIEFERNERAAGLRDLNTALKLQAAEKIESSPYSHVSHYENQIRLLNQRIKTKDLATAAADKCKIDDLEKELKYWKKQVSDAYSARISKAISANELEALISTNDPFPSSTDGGSKSVYMTFRTSDIPPPELSRITSGKEIKLKSNGRVLHVYPWGFLQVRTASQSDPIDTVVLQTPYMQYSELTNTWRGADSHLTSEDELKVLNEIFNMKGKREDYEFDLYIRGLIRVKEFDTALRLCPSDDYYLRSEINYEAGRYDEALRLIRQAKTTRNGRETGEENRMMETRILVAQKQFDQANKVYSKLSAGTKQGWSGEMEFLHGQILLGLNKVPEAKKQLISAKDRYFNNAMIRERDQVDEVLRRIEKPIAARQTACGSGDIFVSKKSR